jgi:hypothetical protein
MGEHGIGEHEMLIPEKTLAVGGALNFCLFSFIFRNDLALRRRIGGCRAGDVQIGRCSAGGVQIGPAICR